MWGREFPWGGEGKVGQRRGEQNVANKGRTAGSMYSSRKSVKRVRVIQHGE